MEKKNGKKFATNQHAMLVIDGIAKEFHFNGISNSIVTEVRRPLYHQQYDADIRRPRLLITGTSWKTQENSFRPNVLYSRRYWMLSPS